MATEDAMDVVESHSHTNTNASSSTSSQPHDRFMDVENKNLSRHVIDEAISEVRQAIVTFLTHRTAEAIVPTNSRVVMLDGSIQLRQAYRALFENDVRAAPVLDMVSNQYIDLFCASHALDTILANRGGPADFTSLANYLSILSDCEHRLPKVKATDSLLKACQLLRGKYRPPPPPPLRNAECHENENNESNNTAEIENENENQSHHHHQLHEQLNAVPNNNQASPTSPTLVPPGASPSSPAANSSANVAPPSTSAVTTSASPINDINPPSINHALNSTTNATITTSTSDPTSHSNAMLSSNLPLSQPPSSPDHAHPLPSPALPQPPPTVYHSGHPHRVAIMIDETVLCVLDHGRMLRFVHHHLNLSRSRRLLLSLTLNELQLSPLLRPLISVHTSDSVLHTLHLLRQHQLGAIPVVDDVGKPVNVFARSDAACLAGADWTADVLNEQIGLFLQRVRYGNFAVVTCKKCDCLATVFRRFELSRKHRLFVVNDHGVVVAQLTLNDLLCFFLEGV